MNIQRFFLCIVCILIVIVGLEFCLRHLILPIQEVMVTFKGDPVTGSGFILSKDPILLYELHSFPQVFAPKQDHMYRIAVIGDSVVFRRSEELNESFPAILEKRLNSQAVKTSFEVLNAGVPGYNTQQEARFLETRVLPFSPDLLIVGYCSANDRVIKRRVMRYKDGLYVSDVRESFVYIAENTSSWMRFLFQHSIILRWINSALIKAVAFVNKDFFKGKIIYSDYSLDTEEAVIKIKQLALKNKMDLIFVIFPLLDEGDQGESDWIIKKCLEYQIPYIDLRGVFSNAGYANVRISNQDVVHPNQAANYLIADEIFQYLKGRGIY